MGSTTGAAARTAEHTVPLRAPAGRAYGLIADVSRWPLLFAPCVWAEELDSDAAGGQRIRLWAVVGHEVRSWTSARTLDPDALWIDFRQETPAPPLTAMSGYWRFGDRRLTLGHRWETGEADPEQAERIAAALDANSTVETAAVRTWAERAVPPRELMFTVEDRVRIAGPVEQVYDFLYRADLWPQRVPHVAGLDLETAPAGPLTAGAEVQTLDMVTAAPDGSRHTTQSVRLCFAGRRIVYKQTSPPRGLLAHSGEWLLAPAPGAPGETVVIARHHGAVDPAAVAEVFGAGTDLPAARQRAGAALGGNSLRTLERARLLVEAGQGTVSPT
ncbi:aromatase/cyclase [Streptomyces xiamenensis]|uniref:aromatase/cyclase n=1 Tax=Streptomyces xiamenensis TaxID=408015 RepID=UPI0036E07FD8